MPDWALMLLYNNVAELRQIRGLMVNPPVWLTRRTSPPLRRNTGVCWVAPKAFVTTID